jgi:hypothetical protein
MYVYIYYHSNEWTKKETKKYYIFERMEYKRHKFI